MSRSGIACVTLILVVLLVPSHAAQPGQGTVTIAFEPDQVAVPVGGHRNVTIQVNGSIECLPAFGGPTMPVEVSGKHGARHGTATGDIYRFEPMPIHVDWTPDSDDRYVIDEAITVRVVSEVPPPEDTRYNATYWTTGTGSREGCTPGGYDVPSAAPATLEIHIYQPSGTKPAEAPITGGTVATLLLGLAAAFLRRR